MTSKVSSIGPSKLDQCRAALSKAMPSRARPAIVHAETRKKPREAKVPAHLLAWAVRRIEFLEDQARERAEQ